MKKNFLLLMLMALLPLAGFADWTTTPTAKTGLTYDQSAKDLINAGTASGGKTAFYAVVADGAAAPAVDDYATTVPQATNAGDYDVYYVEAAAATAPTAAEIASAPKLDVNIAKAGTIVVQAKNPTMVYGGTAPTLADFYEITSGTFLSGESVATLGAPVDEPTIDMVNAGSKPFTLVAREYVNYNVSLTVPSGTLTIAKKAITVTTAAIENITYGAATPTFDVVDYSASLIGTDALAGTLAFDIKQGDDVITASPLPAGTYDVYPKGLANDNYAITFEKASFTVNQKALAPTMIAAMAEVEYTGAKQAPTLTVADGTLLKATDYTATWKDADNNTVDPTAADAFVKAGTYTVTLAGNTSNYKTPAGTEAEPAATATYKINQKTLYVKTKNSEKTYDGTTVTPAANSTYLTYVGLAAADAASSTTFTGLTVSLGDGAISGSTKGLDADVYPINVTGSLPTALATNYTPEFGSIGKLTINKREITITPNTITKNYGTADTYTAGVVATACTATSTTAGTAKLTGTLASGESFKTLPTLTRAAGETATDYALTASGAEIKNSSDGDVTKNYEITYTPGKYTIVAAGFTIWADDKESVFGTGLKTLTASVSGIPAEDAAKIVYGEGAITTDATATSNRGSYTITIDKTKIDFSQIEDLYDIDAVTVVPGNYVITPAALKIKAADQSLQVGEAVLAASAETIEFVTEGVSEADQAKVIANVTLSFSTTSPNVPVSGTNLTVDATTSGWTAADAAATEDADKGIWYKGIAIDATAYNALTDANYTLNATVAEGAEAKAGKLIVSAADAAIVLKRVAKADFADATKNTAAALIAANDGKKVDVTFTFPGQTMYANKWYSMVLPFNTTARAISKAFGYAVVDVLDQSKNEASDVYFKLNMGTVNANEPFIVKVDKDITAAEFEAAATTIKFEGVTIVNSAAPEVADAYGNKFIGTYAGKDGGFDSTKDYVFGFGKDKTTYDPAGTDFSVRPLGAWITFKDAQTAGAPTIHIEEIDGSVTAIKAFIVENAAEVKEGWYTLNGVKLNAAPTEKGVYILNGKKFVVK